MFTLIIPHHNQPQLLERLLRSLPVRNDLQVVVVDDASGTECATQLDDLKGAFPAVEFVMLPCNRGGGFARNEGLKRAKGEWVFFADADDCFLTDALDGLLDQQEHWKTADLVFFGAKSVDDDTGMPSWRADRLNWMMAQEGKVREQLLRYQHSEPWCKLVRRDLIERNGLAFDESLILNDVRFSYCVGHHATKVMVDERVCYCVCDRQRSVGKRISSERKKDYTRVMAEANRFFAEQGLPYRYKRVYRPLVFSFMKGEWQDARTCWQELRQSGESALSVVLNVWLYPLWLIQWALRKRVYRRKRITSSPS